MSDAYETGAGARGGQGRVGSLINGKWQVDARLGSGGMATVYAATHRNGHRAALKMLHTTLSRDPSTRARFLREGYVANAVGHPGVVGVLDDGVAEDGAAFLVLELLEGETVDARRVRLGGVLPIDEALDLADQALDALAAAHEKGIVHRDIKPENVFFTKEGRVKLLDFGLARMKDNGMEATKTGVTIGTPEFMPPEQARGRKNEVDARSDVWGLGATLFTAITGRYVHDDAQSLHEQLIASATRRSRPLRQLAPHVSPAVATVIDRALELEMNDRWQSAREMQLALREACGGAASASSSDRYTADSVTHASAPLASGPYSHDKPASSDQTMTRMNDAPPRAAGRSNERSAFPNQEWAAAGEHQRAEDTRDMEATFIEGQGAAAPKRPGVPVPSARGSLPPPTPPPQPQRKDFGVGKLPRPSNPPPNLLPFRGPILTPSDLHATTPSQSVPRVPHDFVEDGPTMMSPRSFPIEATVMSSSPPRSFPVLDHGTSPVPFQPDPHAATMASPRSFRPSNPPPAFSPLHQQHQQPSQQQQQQQQQQHPQHHHAAQQLHTQMLQGVPHSHSRGAAYGPTGPHQLPPPMTPQPSSTRAIIYLSLVFVVVIAAMAAWVFAHGATPP